MNAFMTKIRPIKDEVAYRGELKILQVNLGDLCNQNCSHCHINGGPQGKKVMSKKVIDDVLQFLKKNKGLVLDITGGAPEMNPDFIYLVAAAKDVVKETIVRSNLTVLTEKGKESLPLFFKENNVHLICSLPCYTKDNVNKQRGDGVFEKSIAALKRLNTVGYGQKEGLLLDLVYNPGGAFLPGPQDQLEADYKTMLKKEYDVDFNRLLTITNVPVNRFKQDLEEKGELDKYKDLLESNFNEEIAPNIMCRTLLSVGWDGRVYDCDFNQALDLTLMTDERKDINIKDLDLLDLKEREILFGDHCFSCTAGLGSSCQGAL
jgi:radical SAM/Cys-rich protein